MTMDTFGDAVLEAIALAGGLPALLAHTFNAEAARRGISRAELAQELLRAWAGDERARRARREKEEGG